MATAIVNAKFARLGIMRCAFTGRGRVDRFVLPLIAVS